MIRKTVEIEKLKFSINQETGELDIEDDNYGYTISSEDATELLIELRKQQLDYLQRKQDQEESSIMKLLKSLCK